MQVYPELNSCKCTCTMHSIYRSIPPKVNKWLPNSYTVTVQALVFDYTDRFRMILSKLLPCLLLAIELSAAVTNINSTDLHLIVGLPLQQDTGATSASWEKGWQILPSAQIAVESINDRPDILPGHKLQTVVVDTGNCGAQNFNLILQFVNHSYHQDVTFIGAVGILCPTELQIIFLTSLAALKYLQLYQNLT